MYTARMEVHTVLVGNENLVMRAEIKVLDTK